jgi:hypothetical protein
MVEAQPWRFPIRRARNQLVPIVGSFVYTVHALAPCQRSLRAPAVRTGLGRFLVMTPILGDGEDPFDFGNLYCAVETISPTICGQVLHAFPRAVAQA